MPSGFGLFAEELQHSALGMQTGIDAMQKHHYQYRYVKNCRQLIMQVKID